MGKKLLVADDSVTIQKVIKLALSSEGYDILAVSDGREAIRAIQEELPDVVLIDVALSGADAYQVKKAINADPKFASIGFLLLASAFERVDEKQVDEVGFNGRLIKPFDPSHLRKAVGELMGKVQAPPPPPGEFSESTDSDEDDLPPVTDMHPTIKDNATKALLAEHEFKFDTPLSPPTGPNEPTIVMPPPIEVTLSPIQKDDEDREEAIAVTGIENDIKDLTESTIKISGLDEFQWNLDDTRKMKAPGSTQTTTPPKPKQPVAPPPPTSDVYMSDRTIEIQRPNAREASLKNVVSIPTKPIDDGGANFPVKSASPAAQTRKNLTAPTEEPRPTPPHRESGTRDATTHQRNDSSPPITRAEIEEIIRKDVAEAIERMAREVVPQIAEAIIRKEIEKILAET